jgi:hypothetical protein
MDTVEESFFPKVSLPFVRAEISSKKLSRKVHEISHFVFPDNSLGPRIAGSGISGLLPFGRSDK